MRFWDSRVSCNDPLTEIELNGKVTSLDLARNGHQLLVATRDDTLRLLDLRLVYKRFFKLNANEKKIILRNSLSICYYFVYLYVMCILQNIP